MSEHESSRLKSWIDAACKLEHLDIGIDCGIEYNFSLDMPHGLFMCNTLVVLKLAWVSVEIPELVSLPNLKIMHLVEFVYADDSAFRTLISSCKVLKELHIVLDYHDNARVMCICSQTLKWLSIGYNALKWLSIGYNASERHPVIRIVIDTPHLEYLCLSDHYIEDLVMKNLCSSLVAEFNVTFNMFHGDVLEANDFSKRSIIRKFLVRISNFKSLSFSSSTLELLSKYLELESLPQFHGVIHLKTTFDEYGWKVLPALLVCCPNLKSFVLECWDRPDEPLIPPSPAPRCLSSLKSITVDSFYEDNKAKMSVVRYFLENAIVLKKMTIRVPRSLPNEHVTDILKELLTLPRCSPACRIFID